MLTLKENKYASRCALKVIDFALTNNGANCERFVDIRGLKTLMPLLGAAPAPPPAFVKVSHFPLTLTLTLTLALTLTPTLTPAPTPTQGKAEREAMQLQHDEHLASLLVTLLQQLTEERWLRLLGKFVEEDMLKTDRLLQLRATYQLRVEEAAVAAADAAVAKEEDDEEAEEEEEDADVAAAESVYAARMAAGAYTMQLLDMAAAYLVSAKQKALLPSYHPSCDLVMPPPGERQAEGAASEDPARALRHEPLPARRVGGRAGVRGGARQGKARCGHHAQHGDHDGGGGAPPRQVPP